MSAPNAANDDHLYEDAIDTTSKASAKTKRLLLDLLGRWHWVALGLIIGLLWSAYYLSKAPKRYSATATLLIKQNIATVINKDQVEEIDMRSTEGMNTVAERIRRFDLMERVGSRADVRNLSGLIQKQVDWTPDLLKEWLGRKKADPAKETPEEKALAAKSVPEPAVLGGMIASWVTVSIRKGTRLLDISIQHQVPEVAKALADAVAREYLAEIASDRAEGRSNQSETLIKQSEEARSKLQAAESALATYNRALQLHGALDQQESEFSQLSRRYLPKHPRMIATTDTLADLRSRFMAEFKIAMSSPADKEYWKTVQAEMENAEKDPDLALKTARQLLLARTGILKGETASQMSVFNSMLTRLEESNVNREGNESAAEISSFARNPGWAHWPQPRQVYTTGGMFGLACGALIALILTRLDNKFRTVAQVEGETSLPVFAAISDIDIRLVDKAVRAKLRRNKDLRENPIQSNWDPRLLFRPGAATTTFAEMFRILRASVSLLGDESRRKVTLFSSALPGEGKSLVSSNFALAAAGQGRKTLLIDLDLRKPSLHKVFGFTRNENGAGVTELLASKASLEEAITTEVGSENLHVIFSGNRAPNPGELLNMKRLKELFVEVSEKYDLIVVDSAPLLAVPDTRVLVQLANNFCLVVRSNYVPKGAVARALELLGSSGTLPAGIVFNGYKETRRMISQNYSYGGYRMSRYGRPYQYGYGTYGAYGEDDRADDTDEILKRRRKNSSRRNKEMDDGENKS